jgi:hypothetical protein
LGPLDWADSKDVWGGPGSVGADQQEALPDPPLVFETEEGYVHRASAARHALDPYQTDFEDETRGQEEASLLGSGRSHLSLGGFFCPVLGTQARLVRWCREAYGVLKSARVYLLEARAQDIEWPHHMYHNIESFRVQEYPQLSNIYRPHEIVCALYPNETLHGTASASENTPWFTEFYPAIFLYLIPNSNPPKVPSC